MAGKINFGIINTTSTTRIVITQIYIRYWGVLHVSL